MVKALIPQKGPKFKSVLLTGSEGDSKIKDLASQDAEKGSFIVSLGHQPSGDTGAPNTAAPSTNGSVENAFDNESEVISSVAVDLLAKVVGLGTGFAFIPWVAKSLLSKFISKSIRKIGNSRTFDCLIQIHSDMVKKYAIKSLPGDIIIYYGSNRGFNVASQIADAIADQKVSLISTVNLVHHTKSWRGRLGFIADSADTALILEYDSVARDKSQMSEIAAAINKALITVQPNLKNTKY